MRLVMDRPFGTICRKSSAILLVTCIILLWLSGGVDGQRPPPSGGPGGSPKPGDGGARPSRRPTSRRPTPPTSSRYPPPPRPSSRPSGGCDDDDDCRPGHICRLSRCSPISTPPPPPTTRPNTPGCTRPTILQILEKHFSNRSRSFLYNLKLEFGKEVTSLFSDPLANLTVFVPSSSAFEAARNGTLERTVHSNSECLRATLRLHILLRPFNTSDLARVRSVSSLEGFQINILGSAPRPLLQVKGGTAQEVRITPLYNIPACNGVVHFIDDLLTPTFTLPDTQSSTLLKSMEAYSDLSDFVSAVKATHLGDLLTGNDQYTVFAPTNQAFQRLAIRDTTKTLSALLKAKHISELINLVRSHISPRIYSVVDLARTSQAGLQIASLSGHPGNGSVRILPNGSIAVYSASLRQANITATNGILHIINDVFFRPYVANFCTASVTQIRPGNCSFCRNRVPSGLSCRGGQPVSRHDVSHNCGRPQFCAFSQCRFVINEAICCSGYFGPTCLPCPRSSEGAVCSGRGMCNDNMTGDGSCNCLAGYTGVACETEIVVVGTFSNFPRLPISMGVETDIPEVIKDSQGDSSSPGHTSIYFLIPLSIGATLALLVVIAGIVLWRMKRKMVPISQAPTAERVPTTTLTFQPVPGTANRVVPVTAGHTAHVILAPRSAVYVSASMTTMESIAEEPESKSLAEEESPKTNRRSLSNVSVSELVANQHPMGEKKDVQSSSLEATSSNELLYS